MKQKRAQKSFITRKKRLSSKPSKPKVKRKRSFDEFDSNFTEELKLRSSNSCLTNPNYAIICDFLIKFTELLDLPNVPLKDLQLMIGAQGKPHEDLIKIHIKLLRKLRMPKIIITNKNWEKALVMFCERSGDLEMEGINLETSGYADTSVNVRLEILKCLMDELLVYNETVKEECDHLPRQELRQEPTGWDLKGNIFWTQMSDEGDLRVYSENSDNTSWETVAQTRESLVAFLMTLREEKIYSQEQEKLDKNKKELDLSPNEDLIERLKEDVIQVAAKNYDCQICNVVAKTRLQLLEHYSALHLTRQIQEKFGHLVNGTICKLCSFDSKPSPVDEDENEASDQEQEVDESLIWIHLGTIHDKTNIVLREAGLKEVFEIKQDSVDEPTNLNSISADVTTEAGQKLNCDIVNSTSCDSTRNALDPALASNPTDKMKVEDNVQKMTSDAQNSDLASSEDVNITKTRRSTRLNKAGLDPSIESEVKSKVKETTQKLKKMKQENKRIERKISCKLCGSYDTAKTNPMYTCSCGNSWHCMCIKPKLYSKPGSSWKCPLCNHAALVAMLEQVLTEFDIVMEKVDKCRLAKLRDNRSASSVGLEQAVIEVNESNEDNSDDMQDEDEEGENEEESQVTKNTDYNRESVKLMVNYYEASSSSSSCASDSDQSTDDEQKSVIARNTCLCKGEKTCVYCKRLKGCTCDGLGTCRLCVMEENKQSEQSSPEIIADESSSQPEKTMSTTELFLLTGKTPEQKSKPYNGESRSVNRSVDSRVRTPRGYPRGQRTPRSTPLSSRDDRSIPSGAVVTANEFRPRNLYQEIISVDLVDDEEEDTSGIEIDPNSPAARYYPDRVKRIVPTSTNQSHNANRDNAFPSSVLSPTHQSQISYRPLNPLICPRQRLMSPRQSLMSPRQSLMSPRPQLTTMTTPRQQVTTTSPRQQSIAVVTRGRRLPSNPRHATITNRPFNLMGRASRLVRPRPSNPTHPPARAVSLGWRVGPRTNRAFTQNMTIAPKDVQVQELTHSSYNDNISSCVDLMGESSDNYGEDSSYDDYAANYQVISSPPVRARPRPRRSMSAVSNATGRLQGRGLYSNRGISNPAHPIELNNRFPAPPAHNQLACGDTLHLTTRHPRPRMARATVTHGGSWRRGTAAAARGGNWQGGTAAKQQGLLVVSSKGNAVYEGLSSPLHRLPAPAMLTHQRTPITPSGQLSMTSDDRHVTKQTNQYTSEEIILDDDDSEDLTYSTIPPQSQLAPQICLASSDLYTSAGSSEFFQPVSVTSELQLLQKSQMDGSATSSAAPGTVPAYTVEEPPILYAVEKTPQVHRVVKMPEVYAVENTQVYAVEETVSPPSVAAVYGDGNQKRQDTDVVELMDDEDVSRYQNQQQIVIDNQTVTSLRPGYVGHQFVDVEEESNLARLPPGILVRKVRDEDIVNVE